MGLIFGIPISISFKFHWWIVLFILPTAIDGITQLVGLRKSNNVLRFVTGMFAGISSVWFTVFTIQSLLSEIYGFV